MNKAPVLKPGDVLALVVPHDQAAKGCSIGWHSSDQRFWIPRVVSHKKAERAEFIGRRMLGLQHVNVWLAIVEGANFLYVAQKQT